MIVWILLIVGALVALAYTRSKLKTSSLLFATLTVVAWLGGAGTAVCLTLVVLTAVFTLLGRHSLRINALTRPVFALYQKLSPAISKTEQAALDAGTVWWDGELFSGKPNWNRLLQHPKAALTTEEQAFLDNQTSTLAAMLDEWEISQHGDMPEKVWDFMEKNRFFAMIIPKKHGGLGFSAQAQVAVLQKLSAVSGSAFSTVGVPNSLGPAELLLKYGTEEQKEYYLPRLADGREIPCFALTGPRAGSVTTSLPDTGVVCEGEYKGATVLGVKLNFSKRYITLAPVATVVGLAFRMFDPEHHLGEKTDIGITVALLPRDIEGMDIGQRHKPLGSPFMNGPVYGKDVFIPLSFLIGGPERRGEGWTMLVECLSVGRCITLPSSSVGGSKGALATSGAYARIRRQFNVPIAKLEGVQEPLARIAANSYISTAATQVTAAALDLGEKPAVPSAILKYNLTEMARQTAIDSMDIHGGKGVITGPSNYLASGYSSVPVAITVEGANILTRTMITFGQGAIRCHPHVLAEMHSARDGDLKAFDKALFGHIGFVLTNSARACVQGLTCAKFTAVPVQSATRRHYQKINRYSAAFAVAVDLCMFTLGGSLKFRELTSGRLADMLSKLYLASCVLKHWQDEGGHSADLAVVDYVCAKLFYEYEEALVELINNLPNRPAALLLRALTLPLGRTAKKPSDKQIAAVVALVTHNSQTRTRMTAGLYREDNGRNPIATYDSLLDRVERAETLYRKINQAVRDGVLPESDLGIERRISACVAQGLLCADDGEFMLAFEKDVLAMVNVDAFPLEQFGSVARNRAGKQTQARGKPGRRKSSGPSAYKDAS